MGAPRCGAPFLVVVALGLPIACAPNPFNGPPPDDGGSAEASRDGGEAGDAAALAVLDTVARRFARGLAAHLVLVDPGRVVIGGGLAHAGELLIDAVRRHLEPLTLAPFDLRVSSLRENAVVVGAVRMALDAAEERLAALL